jgi:hypothetical protein
MALQEGVNVLAEPEPDIATFVDDRFGEVLVAVLIHAQGVGAGKAKVLGDLWRREQVIRIDASTSSHGT